MSKIGEAHDEPLPRYHSIVHLSSSFDHSLRVEFAGSPFRAFAQHRAEPVIADQSPSSTHETRNVGWGNQQTALSVLDYFWQAADCERNWGNSERHRIHHRRAEAF